MEGLLILAAVIVLVVICFLPAVVANRRRHNRRTPISVFNFLVIFSVIFSHSGGFTTMVLFGWLALLVWACSSDTEARSIKARAIKAIDNRATPALKVLTSDDFEIVKP
jgi:Ca2+/Na+ antiporter